VDLRKTPDELFAGLEKNTARKITDAQQKDRLQWERYDATDANTLSEVERMWNEFAAASKTPRFERDWLDPIIHIRRKAARFRGEPQLSSLWSKAGL